ncbi:hypothetical protein BH18ACT13_BH18ACT13_12450 [soil metagenome]
MPPPRRLAASKEQQVLTAFVCQLVTGEIWNGRFAGSVVG